MRCLSDGCRRCPRRNRSRFRRIAPAHLYSQGSRSGRFRIPTACHYMQHLFPLRHYGRFGGTAPRSRTLRRTDGSLYYRNLRIPDCLDPHLFCRAPHLGGSFLVLSDLMDFDRQRAFYLLSYHQPKISQAEGKNGGAGICSECRFLNKTERECNT